MNYFKIIIFVFSLCLAGCEVISGPAIQDASAHDVRVIAYFSNGAVHDLNLKPGEELAQRVHGLKINRLIVTQGQTTTEYNQTQIDALFKAVQSTDNAVVLIQDSGIKVTPIR